MVYIGVIGIDGSGKSTLSFKLFQDLCKTKRAGYISDTMFVGEKSRIHSARQVKIVKFKEKISHFAKRVHRPLIYEISKILDFTLRAQMIKILEEHFQSELIVEDGASLVNLLGWGKLYHKELFSPEMIMKVCEYLCRNSVSLKKRWSITSSIPELVILRKFVKLRIPKVLFFLKIPPRLAMERIISRGQPLQRHENETILDELQQAYVEVLDVLRSAYDLKIYVVEVNTYLTSEEIIKNMEGYLWNLLK